jgi:hypothetical protein
MPRAHAITREKRDLLLNALRAGALYRDAAEAAGIPWRTWMDWSKSVREGTCTNDDVRDLVERAREAYAAANVGLAATVSKAATQDWRAAAWQLDHRRGDPKARHDAKRARWEAEVAEHRAKGTHVENVRNVGEMTDAELRAEARRLADADLDDTVH